MAPEKAREHMANDNKPRPPPGYEAQGGEIDGWWTPEQGQPIRGVLLGRDWHEANGAHFYRLRLLDGPVSATATGRESVTLTAGQVLGVGERFNLRGLREWSGSGRAEVWILPTVKVPTRGGQNVWRFELATKGPKVASRATAHDAAEPWEQDPETGAP